eukprot:scaffold27153_cov33-Tisochrysis_lutea.AAC.2
MLCVSLDAVEVAGYEGGPLAQRLGRLGRLGFPYERCALALLLRERSSECVRQGSGKGRWLAHCHQRHPAA